VFGTEAATRLLFFKIDTDLYDILKTFLVYLEYLSNSTKNLDGIDIVGIQLDKSIVDQLRKLG
jgi:hypothetical protein